MHTRIGTPVSRRSRPHSVCVRADHNCAITAPDVQNKLERKRREKERGAGPFFSCVHVPFGNLFYILLMGGPAPPFSSYPFTWGRDPRVVPQFDGQATSSKPSTFPILFLFNSPVLYTLIDKWFAAAAAAAAAGLGLGMHRIGGFTRCRWAPSFSLQQKCCCPSRTMTDVVPTVSYSLRDGQFLPYENRPLHYAHNKLTKWSYAALTMLAAPWEWRSIAL